MKLTHIESWPILMPLRGTFRNGAGAKSAQPGLVVRVHTASGLVGVANVDPSVGYSSHTAQQCHAIIRDKFGPALVGQDASSVRRVLGILEKSAPTALEACAAVEAALFDLNARALGVPVHRLLGGRVRDTVRFNGWVGVMTPEEAITTVSALVDSGYHSVKLKVQGGTDQDIARVAAVRQTFPALTIRIDGNESLDLASAVAFEKAVRSYDIQLIEQPVVRTDLGALARLRAGAEIPIMADEAVTSLASIVEIIRSEAADCIKLKLMKHGGFLRTIQGIELCEAAGLPCVLGHGFGLTLHTLAEMHIAAVCSNVLDGCEAVGPAKMRDDVVVQPIDVRAGSAPVPDRPGLGAELDEDKLMQYLMLDD